MKDKKYIETEIQIKKCYDILNEYVQCFLNCHSEGYSLRDVFELCEELKRDIQSELNDYYFIMAMNVNLNKECKRLNEAIDKRIYGITKRIFEPENATS